MLSNIATCMENYGAGDGSEWGNNIVSRKAVQGPSGRVAYPGNVDYPPAESALVKCQALAEAAYALGKSASFDIWGSEGAEALSLTTLRCMRAGSANKLLPMLFARPLAELCTQKRTSKFRR